MNTELGRYIPVLLSDISKVSLLDRIDSKYLMAKCDLVKLLETLRDYYFVIEIEDKRVLPYNTVYYDTDDLFFYHSHHNGKLNRFKFRTREYVESGIVFNEIKRKVNTGRTKKMRFVREDGAFDFDHSFKAFVEEKCGNISPDLIPQLNVKYSRITLVDKEFSERMTIDLNLEYSNEGVKSGFENLVIVEVKQNKGNKNSEGVKILRKMRSRKMGFSKYCIGIATTHQGVKINNFKEKIRLAEKLSTSGR